MFTLDLPAKSKTLIVYDEFSKTKDSMRMQRDADRVVTHACVDVASYGVV